MRLISIVALVALAFGARPALLAPATRAEIVDYRLIRPTAGWLLTRDRLYLTQDEGGTWQDITPPREGAYFFAADFLATGQGWLVAGQPGAEEPLVLALARTTDFGASWQWAPLSLFAPGDPDPAIAEVKLAFDDPEEGRLRVWHASSSNFERRSEWQTADGGATWTRVVEDDITAAPNGVSEEPAARFLPSGKDGWRLDRTGRCAPNGSNRTCEQETALRATHDGGETWREVALPPGIAPLERWSAPDISANAAAVAGGRRTMIALGQGFDKCEVTTIDQAYAWRSSSPYSVMNLYIGGSKRGCRNSALSPDYLRTLYSMGWTFIPTWVGPQAPCSSLKGISEDPATAQSQGWAESQAAADRLASFALAEPNGSGSIAYYDMEYFSTTESCYPAVQAFVTGWSQGLHSRGSLAGLYAHRLNLSHFANLPSPPDAIWAADSYATSYDPSVRVWGIPGLGDDLWTSHQRIRQYTRSHVEGWGGVSLEIDSDVLDGPVALMQTVPDTPTPTATPTATPTPTVTSTRIPFTPTRWVYLPLLVR